MILGVDHIALSCTDVEAASRELEALGFTTKFITRDAPNDPSKRGMLNKYSPFHSIAYCQATRGVAVELTMHGPEVRPGLSPYQVMFDAPAGLLGTWDHDIPSGMDCVWREALGLDKPEPTAIKSLGAQLWVGEGSSVRSVMIPSRDLDASTSFWIKGLGFRQGESGRTADGVDWVRVSVASPVPAWSLDSVLAVFPGMPRTKPMLDDAGFPCIALLSTDIARDSDSLMSNGASERTGTFGIDVGGKRLEVAMFRGPSGELVELIQLVRGG